MCKKNAKALTGSVMLSGSGSDVNVLEIPESIDFLARGNRTPVCENIIALSFFAFL